MNHLCRKAAAEIKAAGRIAALTGAGISVESGIPPFRGKGGLWETLDPMTYAHIDAFMKDPEKVWRVLLKGLKEVLDRAVPNAAHRGLAAIEQLGKKVCVITQNVDGLHQAAGSSDVIEFHGTFASNQCLACSRRYPSGQLELDVLPPRCSCGGILRPECVFFGEMISPDVLDRSRRCALQCDLMLVIGTSATVQPAAAMPFIAKNAGATIIEINPDRTPLTGDTSDYFIQGPAAEIFRTIMAELGRQ